MAKQSLSFALEPRATATLDDYVADCAWSPDGKSLAVAGGEGKVALARLDDRALALANIGEHLLGTLAVAWRPHAKTFVSSGQDGAVALWDGVTGQQIKRWKPAPTPTQALAFSPLGRTARQCRRQIRDAVVVGRREGAHVRAGGEHGRGAVVRQARLRSRGCPERRNHRAPHRTFVSGCRPLRNTPLQVAGRVSHGKLQRQWQISRKRHGRRHLALLEPLDGQGFPDARLRRQTRAGRLGRQLPLSRVLRRQRAGALGLRRQRPRRHEAHRADRPHRTR